MKEQILNIVKNCPDKDDMCMRVNISTSHYEEVAVKYLNIIQELCHYMNYSEFQNPCVVEAYAIVIRDIAENLKKQMTEGIGDTNQNNDAQDAKKN